MPFKKLTGWKKNMKLEGSHAVIIPTQFICGSMAECMLYARL